MSLLCCYSFDDISATAQLLQLGWNDVSNMAIQTSSGNRTGAQCVSCGTGISAAANVGFPVGEAQHDYGVVSFGLWFNGASTGTSEPFIEIWEGSSSTPHLKLYKNTSNQLEVRRNTTVLATSTSTFSVDVQYWVEFKFRIHDSSGYFQVKVNGVDWIAMTTSQDTRNGGTNGKWDRMGICRGGYNNARFDDLHLAADDTGTDDFLGEGTKVYCQFPVNEGNYNGSWSPSTGTDESDVVDETPGPNTTDYIEDNTVGHKSSFTHAALGVTGTVNMVEVTSHAWKDVSGDLRQFRNFLRVSGADYTGSTVTPATGSASMQGFISRWRLNPATSAAWSVSDVDAMEPGVELVT